MRRRRDRPRLIGEIVFRHPARCEAASPESITPAGHGKIAWRRNEPGARVDVVHPMTAIHAVLRDGRAVASEEWRGSNGPVSAYLTSISAMCDLSSGEV
jgi:hypothetical protein